MAIQAVGVPIETRPPNYDIREMPLQLGNWKGEEVVLDERLYSRIGADVTVDRSYRDDTGYLIMLQVGVFGHWSIEMPHPPPDCYRLAGYQIVGEEEVQLATGDGSNSVARLLTMTHNGQATRALYWYQLGSRTVVRHEELRQANWAFRGERAVPPVVKVLLHDNMPASPEGRDRLRELARLVYEHTKGL